MSESAKADEHPINVEALRDKYRVERDRRLRADGNAQYVGIEGELARYLDDPWASKGVSREPVQESVEVLIVGGGFGALLTAARLRQSSISDFRMVEKAADFGGTWYWNRYPGAACDTESYIYLPLLEETGYIPVRKYARAPEILEHSQRIGRHFDLYSRALFQTVVKEMRWQEKDARWLVTTDRGDAISARFVVLAGGPLSLPKLPGIPGVETFKGHSFHTSRWDYAYTGGNSHGGLTGLRDKRVGVIGTGATAVQCVPHLGEWSQELFVFQRTPSAIDVRNDRPTDPHWAENLRPGWQRARMDNFTSVISGGEFDEDLVQDGWTDLIGGIMLAARRKVAAGQIVEDSAKLIELADFQKMERIRVRVDEVVRDASTAEALKPWYSAFCKRPCFHDEYLATFNRPNVRLVDTKGRGVERITEHGVVVDGVEQEIDCLVFATGFEISSDYARRTGFKVYGRDGISLSEKWRNGTETLHGFYSRGFPNCLLVITSQTGQSANFAHIIDEQSQHIAYVIDQARKRGLKTFEPLADAESDWVETVVRAARGRQRYLADCTPGYYNNEGAGFDEREAKNSQYWRGPDAYLKLLSKWRSEGRLAGLDLTFENPEASTNGLVP